MVWKPYLDGIKISLSIDNSNLKYDFQITVYIWLGVFYGIKFGTFQFFTINFSSRASTVIVELSRSFSQVFREIYKEKKNTSRTQKIRKNSLKSFPLFFLSEIKLEFLNKSILKKSYFANFFLWLLFQNR